MVATPYVLLGGVGLAFLGVTMRARRTRPAENSQPPETKWEIPEDPTEETG
jgi:hypothetical protein